MIPGGINNAASANFTAAMGYRAKANHNGAFVWADSQEADFASTATNQFNVRASGGVRFETGGAGLTVDGRSALLASAIGEPLVFSVNGTPALRIEQTLSTPNVIGGYEGNIVSNGVVGGFIGGGGGEYSATSWEAISVPCPVARATGPWASFPWPWATPTPRAAIRPSPSAIAAR